MGISDAHNVPVSDTAAAEMRQEAAQRLSNLPALLQQEAVGATWDRSAEQSMREYELLDNAAQDINILKAMNVRDRYELQREAKRKRKEEAPGVLKAMKYRISPEELRQTRKEMRELEERGIGVRCVEDCMPYIIDDANLPHYAATPSFVYELKDVERMMDKARATAVKLRTDRPGGHWAIEILESHSEAWLVWLDEFHLNLWDGWYLHVWDEKMEGVKQRAKVAEEIVKEVEKEKASTSFGSGWVSGW